MAATTGGDEMESVKNYFNTTGFERWNKIYGTTAARIPFPPLAAPPSLTRRRR